MEREIANQFSGLPIRDLIGGPLMAACEAQNNLARSTSEFIKNIGFDDDKGNLKIVDFAYSQLQADGTKKDFKLQVPMLSIVKIPNLSIKHVDIQFDMEVKSSTSETEKTEKKAGGSVKSNWWSSTVEISGSVSTAKENTRNTDSSAKYHIELHAADEGMPEGLARVLDLLNSVIVPSDDTKKDSEPLPDPAA